MEISVEVNKYLAEEMAKKVIGTISEEELKEKAIKAYKDINQGDYWHQPELNKAVNKVYLDALTAKVEELMSSEPYQQQAKKEAELIIDEILKKTKEKMIEEVSNRLAGVAISYDGMNLRNMIRFEVQQMMHE